MAAKNKAGEIESVLAALARGIVGEAYVVEIPGRMQQTLDQVAAAQDRKQILNALRLLNTRIGALALTGRPIPVSWLRPAEAEALIQKWRAGRNPMTRRLAGVILSLALSSCYAHPSAKWDRIGYPGPLGPPPDEPRRLEPMTIESDEVMYCDVVIVGSGAGGGCAAAGLAKAGLDVIVLEKGSYNSESDFTHLEPEALKNMYLYGMTIATADLGCRIVAGSTLGGGTVVNYTTSFRTPDHVLEEWARLSGMDFFVSGEFEESLDEVSARLGVNADSSAAGKRDALMEEGLKQLGWHVDMMPRAVRGCSQDENCGYCGFGCRLGAKQSTMRTYLEDAAANGTRIIVGADVKKVNIEDGRATGVTAGVDGRVLLVNARAVVSSCGAIESPALLLRSGLGGRVGHNLHLHPGAAPFGIFDEEVRIWEGTTQARYSNEFRDWDGGYGPIFETVPVHPGAGSTVLPWISAAQHRELMDRFANLGFCAVLPRDQTSGRVRTTREGGVRVEYKLTRDDERRIADGVVAAARVLEAAGAREIFSLHPEMYSYRPGPGAHERWAETTRGAGYRQGRVTLFSYHQMGSCSIGRDPRASVVDADHETHEVKNLFVVDGSNFPTASGVNPMLSIYGFANRAAKRIAARLA
ncbi:MAG: GMC family oxidoreductase N-terminal domain-containing protein [Actinomycetota bacterium]|nr:GMC family oxidoreductase N-terminal domain-containing protein [Actinomycetota bacterium]